MMLYVINNDVKLRGKYYLNPKVYINEYSERV